MSDTPAWLAEYVGVVRPGAFPMYETPGCAFDADDLADMGGLINALVVELGCALDRIAVLESGQREMETRLPTEGGL